MIINGGSRRGAGNLAQHLLREDTNEHVQVIEIHHPSQNLGEALGDWQLMSHLTEQGKLGLYHANIDPDGKYEMSPDQWKRSVEVLEKELGLEGQPRAIIKHEKGGREHIHVVWQRTDIDSQTLRSDNWNYAAHERAARQLEKEFGHDHVQGKHVGRDQDRAQLRSEVDRTLSYAEYQQAQRAGKDAKQMKELVTNLFHQSNNGADFQKALADEGYILAQGNKRSLVLVDQAQEVYSLSRYTKGVLKAERDAKLGDLEQKKLLTVDQAQAQQKEHWLIAQSRAIAEAKILRILVDEKQIIDNPQLQKLDEKFKQDKQQLIQYQKDEQNYQTGIWADKIDYKTKIFKRDLEKRQKREFWADWGIDADNLSRRKNDMINNAMQAVYFRRHAFWMKWDDTRKGDVSDNIKKYHAMREKRLNPKKSIMKTEARKKIYEHRKERDAEELIAFVDDLHRDRDDDRLAFEREQAQERLNLEQRRQEELAQELFVQQKRQEDLQKAKEDREKQRNRDRDNPRDRDR